jgi:hypothetical protein
MGAEPLARFMYMVRNDQGRYYCNRNSGSTSWVAFEKGQVFSNKGTASAAANRTNHAYEPPNTRNIPAQVIKFRLREVE